MSIRFLLEQMKMFSNCGENCIMLNIQKSLNIHFLKVNFMLCLLHLNKTFFKINKDIL